MDRVYESGAAATPPSPPASPSIGYPTAGNPSTPTPATKPGPYLFYQLVEEIREVITSAGLTPDHTDLTQLRQAIQRLILGGDYKASVRVATTASITLSGEQTIDGVAIVAGDRVLVKDQAAGAENGIYVTAAGAWSRDEDANSAGDLTSGVLVPVESGTANADTIWMLVTDGAITIGTTALTWQIKSGDASTTRKGQVQLATSAEVADGTDAQKAVSPATLLSGLLGAGGNSGDDYITIPYRDKTTGVRRNLIIQRVGVLTNTSADAAFTFPIAFPTGILKTFASLNIGTGANYTVGAAGTSLSGGIAFTYVGSTGARIAANVNVFVIGH